MWQYGVGPIVSIIGGPKALMGRTAAVPSTSGPLWQAAIAAIFWLACSRPANADSSSGADMLTSR